MNILEKVVGLMDWALIYLATAPINLHMRLKLRRFNA